MDLSCNFFQCFWPVNRHYKMFGTFFKTLQQKHSVILSSSLDGELKLDLHCFTFDVNHHCLYIYIRNIKDELHLLLLLFILEESSIVTNVRRVPLLLHPRWKSKKNDGRIWSPTEQYIFHCTFDSYPMLVGDQVLHRSSLMHNLDERKMNLFYIYHFPWFVQDKHQECKMNFIFVSSKV